MICHLQIVPTSCLQLFSAENISVANWDSTALYSEVIPLAQSSNPDSRFLLLALCFLAAAIFLIISFYYLKKIWAYKAFFSQQLIQNQIKLQAIYDGADLSLWEWDLAANKVTVDQRWLTLLNISAPKELDTFKKWKDSIHPEDRGIVLNALHEHIRNRCEFFECEYRIRDALGNWKWIQTRGRITQKRKDGRPLRLAGIHFDISTRKDIEEALKASERMSRSLVINSPMGMHFYELQANDRLVFIGANPSADRLLGTDNAQFIGKTIEEAFPPLVQTEIPYRYRRAAQLAENWTTESITYKDDQIVGAFEVRAFQTTPGKMVAVFLDITPRKQAEETLKKSEQRFRVLVETSPDAIMLTDSKGIILMANDQARSICGEESVSAMIGKNGLNYLEPREIEKARRNLEKILQGQMVQNELYQFVKANGVHFPGELSSAPITNETGAVTAVVSISRDVSSRLAAQEQLRRSEERFRTLFELAAVGVAQISINSQTHVRVNEKYSAILGYTQEELIGQSFRKVLCTISDALAKQFENLKGGIVRDFISEERFCCKNGSKIWVTLTASAMGNSVPGPVYYIIIVEDITERKQKQQELAEKTAELERFVYLVSHDLKTPLITLGSFLGFIEQDISLNNKTDLTVDLQHMKSAVAKMGALLKDLLELTRIGRLVNPSEHFSLKEIVSEAALLLKGPLELKKAQLTVEQGEYQIFGDKNRIMEVFLNLIDNAIKYTGSQQKPKIEIGTFEKENTTYIFVKDNGLGIEPQYHEKIFNLFDKLDAQSEGTGVGLTLVKRVIEFHGGKIYVQSQGIGKGTMFYFNLPR